MYRLLLAWCHLCGWTYTIRWNVDGDRRFHVIGWHNPMLDALKAGDHPPDRG